MCLKQSISAGELAALHAGEPRESEKAAWILGETSRWDGRADEGVLDGHVEPVQLRQQRVQRSCTTDQGRTVQAAGSPAEGAAIMQYAANTNIKLVIFQLTETENWLDPNNRNKN